MHRYLGTRHFARCQSSNDVFAETSCVRKLFISILLKCARHLSTFPPPFLLLEVGTNILLHPSFFLAALQTRKLHVYDVIRSSNGQVLDPNSGLNGAAISTLHRFQIWSVNTTKLRDQTDLGPNPNAISAFA